MRIGRLTLLAAVAVSTVLALGGSANAAPGRAFHIQFTGSVAEAIWQFDTGSTRTEAIIFADHGRGVVTGGGKAEHQNGTSLSFVLWVLNLDANGAVLGGTVTFGTLLPYLESSGNYSASFDPLLRRAAAAGTGVPATTCTVDPDLAFITCADTTIDLSATWTGEGPIGRGTDTTHFKNGFGGLFNSTIAGARRDATASASIAGTTLPVTTVASLFRNATADVFVCTGPGC